MRKMGIFFISKFGLRFHYNRGYFKNLSPPYLINIVALNCVVCSGVGVLGTKKISGIRSTEIHSCKKSVGKPHMNIHHFHDLQLQLSFSNSSLRVINYCAFQSQNNSDSVKI